MTYNPANNWFGESSPFEDKTRFPDKPAREAHDEFVRVNKASLEQYDKCPTPYSRFDIGDETRGIRAHYKRMDPKVKKQDDPAIEAILAPFYGMDEYNFYQRKCVGDGLGAIPRKRAGPNEIEDYKRMFVSQYHKGNPQGDNIRNPDSEQVDYEITYLGIPPTSVGQTSREKSYWRGKVYITNLVKGRRQDGALLIILSKYFGVSKPTIWAAAKFASACDSLDPKGNGYNIAKAQGTQSKTIRSARAETSIVGDWELKPYVVEVWTAPWKQFGGERAYMIKELEMRKGL